MPSYKKIIGISLSVIAISITSIIAIDLVTYLASSSRGIDFLPSYKKDKFKEKLGAAVHYFPRGYNVADPIMGFDIKKNVAPIVFNMADGSFPIFSNDVGCFDHHTLAEIKSAKSYDYFAGDSFAWGYGNYEQNIPSTYEKKLGALRLSVGLSILDKSISLKSFSGPSS